MGSRSRKRARSTAAGEASGPAPASSRAARDDVRRRRADSGERSAPRGRGRKSSPRPEAPWGSFPLTELVVLLAVALGIAGLVVGLEEARGRIMLLAAVALGSLGGLELAIRDHFAGYRSHTTLLAGAAAALAVVALSVALTLIGPALAVEIVLLADLALGALVFTLTFFRLRRLFQRRSGGLSFR
jgi:hypothetical protein